MSGFHVAVCFDRDGPWIGSFKADRAERAVFIEKYPI